MDLLDLFVKISVQDEASAPAKKIAGAIGKGFASAVKVGTAAIGAAGVALGKLGTDAVRAYADYEQLVGGVETLFENMSTSVQQNAANAFKTAGLSASEYMETAMGFAASLNQSLRRTDGDISRSAALTDMAITDMADNSNKMGTSMESIQAAYAGFAKQNYTMLDNLKLGYGGTKTEMERLLADAEELTGVKYDIENLSDVYEAIHAIQNELGITGTTAEEAAKTVSGSFNSLKGAWKNFLVGLGDKDANISELVGQLIESAGTLLENLEPVVMQVLEGLGEAVEELGPILGEKIPEIIMTLAPSLINAAIGLVGALAEAIPEMLGQIWEAVDTAISESSFGERWASIKEAVSTAVEGIKQKWDELKEKLQPIIDKVSEAAAKFSELEEEHHVLETVIEGLGVAIQVVVDIVGALVEGLGDVVGVASSVADSIVGAWEGVATFFDGLAGKISHVLELAYDMPIWAGGRTGNEGPDGIDWSTIGAAGGRDYVPFDNYRANLHRGEAVLTAREADEWRRGGGGRGKVVNLNIYAQQLSQADMDYIVATVNRELA